MATKKKQTEEVKIERPEKAKLSAQDSLKRMQEFGTRKEKFVAAVQKDKNRSVSA